MEVHILTQIVTRKNNFQYSVNFQIK